MKGIATARRALLGGLAVIAVLALSGCGADNAAGTGSQNAGTDPTTATFNEADVAFAQNMIPHHRQAVQMAEMAVTRATDPEVKQLATQIKDAQDPEIRTLTNWLTAWGKPVEPAQGHGGHLMPGMMADADMDHLMAASGTSFDKMFAEMMIAHHNGAIQMARDEQAQGDNADAQQLAATIERTQAAEVTQLQAILDRL